MEPSFNKLLEKYLSGNCTAHEKEELLAKLTSGEYDQQLSENMRGRWDELNKLEQNTKKDLTPVLDALYKKMRQDQRKKTARVVLPRKTFWAAASIIFLIMAGIGIHYVKLNNNFQQLTQTRQTIVAPQNSRVNFTLPDGSRGWLNNGSKISFPLAFRNIRKVQLEGEAFFDVHKNQNKPFVVKTADFQVKVLGTRFNVRNYPDESFSDVVLAEGEVSVSGKNIANPIIMEPDLKLSIDKKKNTLSKETVHAGNYIAWKDGVLKFRDDDFDYVIARLENWYNVDIKVKDPEILKYKIYATFNQENLQEVMELLKLSSPISYQIKPRERDGEHGFKKREIVISLSTK